MRSLRARIHAMCVAALVLTSWAGADAGQPIKPGDAVEVTSGPAPVKVGKKTLTTVAEGAELEALKVNGHWVKVAVSRGGKTLTGWIHDKRLALVESAVPKPEPAQPPKPQPPKPAMPLCAAICRWLERKLLVFLGFVFSSQAEGRRFEPGLALQKAAFHFRKFFSNVADFPPNSFIGELRVKSVALRVWGLYGNFWRDACEKIGRDFVFCGDHRSPELSTAAPARVVPGRDADVRVSELVADVAQRNAAGEKL